MSEQQEGTGEGAFLKAPQQRFKEKSKLSSSSWSVEMDLGDGGDATRKRERALSIFQSAVVNKRFFGAVSFPRTMTSTLLRWKGGNRDRSDVGKGGEQLRSFLAQGHSFTIDPFNNVIGTNECHL